MLSWVLDGMTRKLCFLQGLKVFVLAVQLVGKDSTKHASFSQLMKKQGD